MCERSAFKLTLTFELGVPGAPPGMIGVEGVPETEKRYNFR